MKRMYLSLWGSGKNSIDDVIKKLDQYEKEIKQKTETFVRKLAELGVTEAYQVLAFEGSGDAPRDADFQVEVDGSGNPIRAIIRASGEGLLFWEFGAGNYYNGMQSPNPKAAELGMGIGTYPEQTHVPNPGYWYYYKDGEAKATRSVGTEATMPMYRASIEMITRMGEIAKEVFG